MQLKAKVERVLFPREGVAGDFYIIATDAGCCKGTMRWRPEPGEKLAMTGAWGEYKGSQEFRFKEVWHDIPQDSRSLLHYACELTKGCGPATEEAIWDALGDRWDGGKLHGGRRGRGAVQISLVLFLLIFVAFLLGAGSCC